jgi:crossover junction endonuclease MUS81
MLKEALESISKYPFPLESGADCIILKGFGKKLCLFLDKRLEVYNSNKILESSQSHSEPALNGCVENQEQVNGENDLGDQIIESPLSSIQSNGISQSQSNSQASSQSLSNSDSQTENTLKKSKEQVYKPAHRSGAYAILLALLECLQDDCRGGYNKDKIIERAQKYSEESFVRPKPDTYYTAWTNMARLVTKGLVTATRSKRMLYNLTDQGKTLAVQLLEDSKHIPSTNDIIFNSNTNNQLNDVAQSSEIQSSSLQTSQSSTAEFELIEMRPGTFDVVLLIDKNETGGWVSLNTLISFVA